MMRTQSFALALALGAGFVLMGRAVEAQTVGTFSWQLQPFCNRLTLTVVQQGAQYQLDGTDTDCSGTNTPSAVRGLALPLTGNTVRMGLTMVAATSAVPVAIDLTISLTDLNGTWRDSSGYSGTAVFGANTGGASRPAAAVSVVNVTTATLADSSVTSAKVADSSITTTKIADSSVTSAKIADSSVTSAKIAAGAVTSAKIDAATVQARVIGNCSDGYSIIAIAIDGTISCRMASGTVVAIAMLGGNLGTTLTSVRGFSAASRPATGVYCLTPTLSSLGLTEADVYPQVTVDWAQSFGASLFAYSSYNNSFGCAAGQTAVYTYGAGAASSNSVAFTVALIRR